MEFDYIVVHRPGKQHTNADSLSHLKCRQCGLEVDDSEFGERNKAFFWGGGGGGGGVVIPAWTNQEIHKLHKEGEDIAIVLQWLEVEDVPQNYPPNLLRQIQSLWTQRRINCIRIVFCSVNGKTFHGGELYKCLQLVLLIPNVLSSLHDSCTTRHLGARKTRFGSDFTDLDRNRCAQVVL